MTTQLWYGRQPAAYEVEALGRLRDELDAATIPAYLFANFEVGGHEIDLLVVKPNGLFLVEFKRVGGPVIGAVNGEWRVRNGRGAYPLPGGCGENPYQQMRTQYRVLTEWLERCKWKFLSPIAAKTTRFRPLNYRERSVPRVQIRSLLVFYPELPKGSRLEIEWPVEPVGFNDLARELGKSTKRVYLGEEEIVALAQTLHLTRWEERNGFTPPARRLLQAVHPLSLWQPLRESALATPDGGRNFSWPIF